MRPRRRWSSTLVMRAVLCLASATLVLLAANTSVHAKPCKAMMAKMCKPCSPLDGIIPECDVWEQQCKDHFCLPLCLRLTWEVEVTAAGGPPGMAEELAEERYQLAIQSQLLGDGCVNVLGCCEDNEKLNDWVEHRTFGGYYPNSLLPLPSCREQDPAKREALCTQCKGAAKVILTNKKKGQCPYFPKRMPPNGPILAVFSRSLTPGPAQIPMHINFQERCQELSTIAAAQFGAMKSKFEAKICDCLGCCDPPPGEINCPFPATYASVEHAISMWGDK